MRVLHIAWEYPPLVYGGLGRHVAALSRAQADAGDEVTVVTQGDPGVQREDGLTVVRVPQRPFPYRLPELLTWVGGLDDRLARAALDRPSDVVHVHDWMVGRAGARVSAAWDVPLVATIHATEAGRHAGWLPDIVAASVHLVEQWLVDEADEVIVCSPAMAEEVALGHGRSTRVSVIPNGIDPTGYRRTTQIPPHLQAGSPRLTFVGRIEWEKGVFVAVEAMPAILARHPAALLRIVGTGGQTEAVGRRVHELGLQDHVVLLGHVDEPTLRAVYSSSDLLLAPSSYEPFGIVALEAAAMRVPLIVGDVGGLAAFVTDDRGRRVPANDPAALARSVLAALQDATGTADRAQRAARALPDYSWERIAEQTEAVYRRAQPHERPPRHVHTQRRVW
jgi:glycogen(starch) synthase